MMSLVLKGENDESVELTQVTTLGGRKETTTTFVTITGRNGKQTAKLSSSQVDEIKRWLK